MGSEDFSFVLNEVPGAYVYLATTPVSTQSPRTTIRHA